MAGKISIGGKPITLNVFEPVPDSGTALTTGTANGTSVVTSGGCYRMTSLTTAARIGFSAVYTSGSAVGTAIVAVIPANTSADVYIPPDKSVLHYGADSAGTLQISKHQT